MARRIGYDDGLTIRQGRGKQRRAGRRIGGQYDTVLKFFSSFLLYIPVKTKVKDNLACLFKSFPIFDQVLDRIVHATVLMLEERAER